MSKKIVSAIFVCVLFAGCQQQPPAPARFSEKVKISDLAPAKHTADPNNMTRAVPMFFTTYVLSLPEENLSVLAGIWKDLSDKSIRYKDSVMFKENYLSAGCGKSNEWEPIAQRLEAAGANRERTMVFTILDNGTGHNNEFSQPVTKLLDETAIFYKADQGQPTGVTIGPGNMSLKIRARVIPSARGIASVRIVPVFEPFEALKSSAFREPTYDELVFDPGQFSVSMEPGDFVLLGPGAYLSKGKTLNTVLFSKPQVKGTVLMYLIVCTKIAD